MAKWYLSDNAQTNIDEIIESIIDYTGSLVSGATLYSELYAKFDLIAFMPKIGAERDHITRETFCRGYRIVYELDCNNDVHILTVIHSRRLYPRP